MGFWGRLVAGVVVAAGLFAAGAVAQEVGPQSAPDQKGPVPPTSAWNGSYTQTIPIEVPEFRGLEPNLSLSYDSARGVRNISASGGILGLGWSIDGLSAIERVSGSRYQPKNTNDIPTEDKAASGRGVPSYDPETGDVAAMPDDLYVLDGNGLLKCNMLIAQGDSPSCTAPAPAGAIKYSSRIETYARIRQLTSQNKWELTTKNGTTYTYTGDNFIVSTGGATAFEKTFRWTISEIRDRDGNAIRFEWQCPVPSITDFTNISGAIQDYFESTWQCSVGFIRYFNSGNTTTPIAEVRMYSELRNDNISFSTGKTILQVTQRLKTIAVYRANALVRAYKLTYVQSGYTNLNRLTTVQEFGKDATVDNYGTITGGTPRAPYEMTYTTTTETDGGPSYAQLSWAELDSSWKSGDLNGDGKMDQFKVSSTQIQRRLSTGTGFAAATTSNMPDATPVISSFAMDIDGTADPATPPFTA